MNAEAHRNTPKLWVPSLKLSISPPSSEMSIAYMCLPNDDTAKVRIHELDDGSVEIILTLTEDKNMKE